MKRIGSLLFLALLPLTSQFCTRDATYVVMPSYDGRILFAHDKETMERMIDCAITGRCDRLSIMELLPTRRVFLVDGGTKVATSEGFFSLSNVRRVRILEGVHGGEEGWVYDRMLCRDRSSGSYQAAFARLYGMGPG